MKRLFTLALMGLMLTLTGCASSGFNVATSANTDRANAYQENILLQAANDLAAINMCYLRASGYMVSGTGDPVQTGFGKVVKVGEPSSDVGCTVMAMGLRTQSNMATLFAPFIAQTVMSRVPAAPEEIAQSLIEKGLQFSLLKFGIESVSKVVSSGQAAQTQIATQGIAAAGKSPVILTIPEGGSASVLAP